MDNKNQEIYRKIMDLEFFNNAYTKHEAQEIYVRQLREIANSSFFLYEEKITRVKILTESYDRCISSKI